MPIPVTVVTSLAKSAVGKTFVGGAVRGNLARATASVDIKGIASTLNNLAKLDKRVRKQFVTQAVRSALRPIQQSAKKKVPIHNARNKGDRAKLRALRKSIRTKIRSGASYTKNNVAYGVVGQFYDARFTNETDTPSVLRGRPLAGFARVVEFDRVSYMRSALTENRQVAVQAFKHSMDADIKQEANILFKLQRKFTK